MLTDSLVNKYLPLVTESSSLQANFSRKGRLKKAIIGKLPDRPQEAAPVLLAILFLPAKVVCSLTLAVSADAKSDQRKHPADRCLAADSAPLSDKLPGCGNLRDVKNGPVARPFGFRPHGPKRAARLHSAGIRYCEVKAKSALSVPPGGTSKGIPFWYFGGIGFSASPGPASEPSVLAAAKVTVCFPTTAPFEAFPLGEMSWRV